MTHTEFVVVAADDVGVASVTTADTQDEALDYAGALRSWLDPVLAKVTIWRRAADANKRALDDQYILQKGL